MSECPKAPVWDEGRHRIYGQAVKPAAAMFGAATLQGEAGRRPELVRELEDGTPAIVRTCRGCEAEVLFPCPDGAPAAAIAWLRSIVCERCEALEVEAEERAENAAGRDRRVKESGIPASLVAVARWENIIVNAKTPDEIVHRERALDAAKAWASAKSPEPRGLYFYSKGVGTGKTLLAATAALARCEHSPITWISVAVLVAQLDGAWADEDRKAALKALTGSGAVVLDDVDKIPATGKARATIFAAIEARDQKKAPIIITSNLNPKGLEDHLGEAATSRLAGPAMRLQYPGPDRRLELGTSS